MSDIGHNHLTEASRDKLRKVIASVESLEEDRKGVNEAMREVYADAKAFGFDVKAIRQIVRERKQDKADREEREMILEVYRMAVGDYA